MSHVWFTSKINQKLMHESNSLEIEVEIFWPKTHKILTVKKPVETAKTGLCPVFNY